MSSLASHCGHQAQINQPGGTVSATIFMAAVHIPCRAALSRSRHPLATTCYLRENNRFLSCVYQTNLISAGTPLFALNRLPRVETDHGFTWLFLGEEGRPDRNRFRDERQENFLFTNKSASFRNRRIHLPYGKSDRSGSRNAERLHGRLGVTVGNFLRDLEWS